MARQWVKKEVRRDPLVSFATGVERFVKEKTQTALYIAGAVVAALIFAGILLSAHIKNRDSAYASLLRAGTNIFSNPDYALSLCDNLLSEKQHSAGTHALARYIKGLSHEHVKSGKGLTFGRKHRRELLVLCKGGANFAWK